MKKNRIPHRDYLRIVTQNAWHNRHNDEPLELTKLADLTPKETAIVAAVVAGGVYVAGCVVHTTITIIQGLLS